MKKERENLLSITQRLAQLGLNKGTSGNASVRCESGFLVTPSGMAVEDMTPSSMVHMRFDGSFELQADSNAKKPSSEWRFHRDILASRPEVNAVIHTHSMFATTLACLHKDIPPFHYMIAVAGGDTIRCAPYALFGFCNLFFQRCYFDLCFLGHKKHELNYRIWWYISSIAYVAPMTVWV